MYELKRTRIRPESILEEVLVPAGPTSMQAYIVTAGAWLFLHSLFVVRGVAVAGNLHGKSAGIDCIRKHSKRVFGWPVFCPPSVCARYPFPIHCIHEAECYDDSDSELLCDACPNGDDPGGGFVHMSKFDPIEVGPHDTRARARPHSFMHIHTHAHTPRARDEKIRGQDRPCSDSNKALGRCCGPSNPSHLHAND